MPNYPMECPRSVHPDYRARSVTTYPHDPWTGVVTGRAFARLTRGDARPDLDRLSLRWWRTGEDPVPGVPVSYVAFRAAVRAALDRFWPVGWE